MLPENLEALKYIDSKKAEIFTNILTQYLISADMSIAFKSKSSD